MKKATFKTLITGIFSIYSLTVISQYVWTQKANFPSNGRYAKAFSIGHYGYLGGGNDASNTYTDWWRWDQNTNTWSQIASYPGAAQIGNICFVINGYSYVGLGKNSAYVCQTDLWRYDTSSNAWTPMAAFPGTPRYGPNTFVIGANAYLVGGNPGGPPYLNDCWRYNSITNSWARMTDYPMFQYAAELVFSIGKNGYAGCGGNSSTIVDSMFRYDTGSNTWTSIAPVLTPLGDPAAFVLGDTAYSVSGDNNLAEYLHEVFSYNPTTNTWSSLSLFPGVPRWAAASFTIGNKGYIATGIDSIGAYFADLWEYAPSTTTGINPVSNSSSLLIFPNPAQNSIYVQLQGAAKAEALELYTITGQVVLEQKQVSTQYSIPIAIGGINTQYLQNGVYFLKVQLQDGSTLVKKVEILR